MPKQKSATPHDVDVHVGARIRMRRKHLRYSQEQLAKALGLTFQQVQKYERGSNRVSASKLYEMSFFLECPISYFFDGLPTPASNPESSQHDRLIHEFAVTPEGADLAAVFPKIASTSQRRSLVGLARALAEEAD